MTVATDDIKALVGQVREPYRALLRPIREAVRAQREQLGLHIRDASQPRPSPIKTFRHSNTTVAVPNILNAVGLATIANGKLLDLIRKLDAFGAHLVTLDIRQESTRHGDVVGEITLALGLETTEIGTRRTSGRFCSKSCHRRGR